MDRSIPVLRVNHGNGEAELILVSFVFVNPTKRLCCTVSKFASKAKVPCLSLKVKNFCNDCVLLHARENHTEVV